MVCSVGSDLMLSHGAIATAMSKAAGSKLQDALRDAANGLQSTDLFCEGDIIPTVPGKLPCRHVIHCVCCPWNGETDREKGVRFFSSQVSDLRVLELPGTEERSRDNKCFSFV